MNKKLLTALAGGVALTFGVAGILLVAGDSLKAAIAEEETHDHTATCNIHHYAEIAPTSAKAGVKEYWICCDDPGHKVVFTAPTTGKINDATHGEGFAVEDTDERYIAPYTFPEVFMTKYAYSDGVTFADGKVTAASGSLYFKGSVLKEAYSLGYTHMRFHSKAEGDEAVQVLGTQDNWKNYSKRYANDNDNRYWLKSFSDNNAGLKIDSQNLSGNHVNATLTLSDVHLYKSSITESWGSGTVVDWKETPETNRYIAYEDGELVADNAGFEGYKSLVEIPAEVMGTKADYHKGSSNNKARAFYVKPLARAFINGKGAADENTRIVTGEGTAYYPYNFTRNSDGSCVKTSDGFILPVYNGVGSQNGLDKSYYPDGAMPIGLDHPGAIAIRINTDFGFDYVSGDITSYDVVPLAGTADGKTRLSIENIVTNDSATEMQMNVVMPKSTSHTAMYLKITSTVKPTNQFHCYTKAIDAHIWWPYNPVGEAIDGVYSAQISNLSLGTKGCAIIVKLAETTTNGKITFEFSWVD